MKPLGDAINLITPFSQKTVSGRKLRISHKTNLIYRLPLSRATTVPNFNIILLETISGRKLQICHETNLIYRLPLSRATTVPDFNHILKLRFKVAGFLYTSSPLRTMTVKKSYTYEWLIKYPSDSLKYILLHKFEKKAT